MDAGCRATQEQLPSEGFEPPDGKLNRTLRVS
jgi:hypothetical protein